MQMLRKISLLGTAALLVCAVAASAASATTIRTGSTSGPAYTGPFTGTLKSGTNAVLSGPFGAITCTASSIAGTIVNSNGVVKITSVSFTSCTNASGSNCTVTPYGADGTANSLANANNWWDATATFSAGGPPDGTLSVNMGNSTNGHNGKVRTVCGFITCDWVGSGATRNVSGGTIHNSDSTARFNAALSSGCGNGTWNAQYVLRDSSGNLLFITA